MKIHIPTPLRAYTDKKASISVECATVDEGLAALTAAHPVLQQHLFTPEGKLRSFVNIYLNDDDVRYLPAKGETGINLGDELTIIPSIAGGNAGPLGGSDQTLYQRTLEEVGDSGAVPNPDSDMEHAQALLRRLTPTELLQATFLLEDFVEQTPAFKESLQSLSIESEGKTIPMQEVLTEYGLIMSEDGLVDAPASSNQAA